jgi:site-specific recombinase XerD
MSPSKTLTIAQSVDQFVDTVRLARLPNTTLAYAKAMASFQKVLREKSVDPDHSPVTTLSEEALSWFLVALKDYAPATEQLYLAAVTSYYKFLVAENLAEINLPRLDMLRLQRARRPGQRLPQFPRDDIERVLDFANKLPANASADPEIKLRALRDKAFLVTLADTGLQAVIRFSARSLRALKEYLSARAELDGSSGRPLPSLPLFARHDKGAGRKVKPITTTTGRNIVSERVRQALGDEAEGRITPHSFRHYFVTAVLRGSGNLKLAQELARHANIQTTQKYAHLSDDELDQGYHEIFEK